MKEIKNSFKLSSKKTFLDELEYKEELGCLIDTCKGYGSCIGDGGSGECGIRIKK